MAASSSTAPQATASAPFFVTEAGPGAGFVTKNGKEGGVRGQTPKAKNMTWVAWATSVGPDGSHRSISTDA